MHHQPGTGGVEHAWDDDDGNLMLLEYYLVLEPAPQAPRRSAQISHFERISPELRVMIYGHRICGKPTAYLTKGRSAKDKPHPPFHDHRPTSDGTMVALLWKARARIKEVSMWTCVPTE